MLQSVKDLDSSVRYGIGVSGGCDSMVLLHLMRYAHLNITVINIEHGIRGANSLRDSKFVADFCTENKIPFLTFKVDAKEYSLANKISIESSARELRHGVFNDCLRDKTIDVIALAHHATDNTETILMRLFRGSGIVGMQGIHNSEKLIYPLLNYSRTQIVKYAVENNISWVEDETNQEVDYTRNYLRNQVLPLVYSKYPSLDNTISRLASNMEELVAFLDMSALPYNQDGNDYFFDINILTMPRALAKYSINKLLLAMGAYKDIEASHLNSILDLQNCQNNSIINLPFNITVLRAYDKLVFYRETAQKTEYSQPFDWQKVYIFEDKTYQFLLTTDKKIQKGHTLDFDRLPKDCLIRKRHVGDIFKRYGGGSKSLSDYLTDIKFNSRERDSLLVLAKDNIVYAILGQEISDLVSIQKDTTQVLKILAK